MALSQAKKFGTNLHSLAVDGGDPKIFSKSQQRRFGSEVEVVDGAGKLADIIFSGEEITETTESLGTAIDTVDGSGDISGGIILRSSIRLSNEDVSKVQTEKLRIPL